MSVFIHPTAEVANGTWIGDGTKVWNEAQVREGARIGVNCVLGKSTYVDIDVVIGDRVKIQNGVSVYKGVTLEDDVLVGPNATFTNDLYPRAFNPGWRVSPTLVRRGASIGANATIVCGVTIGRFAMVAAGAMVCSDVPPHALVIGNPARVSGWVCECGQRLQMLRLDGNKRILTCPRPDCGKAVEVETLITALEIPVYDREQR